MKMKKACMSVSVILQFLSLKKMLFDREHNSTDDCYEYKPDNVSFTHLVGLGAIRYYFSFHHEFAVFQRDGCHLSMESISALAGQTIMLSM